MRDRHRRVPPMKSRATSLYPFVPSGRDFAASLAFFAELGFDTLWQHDGLAGLRFGGAYFILQDIDVPEWQKNQMITFEVDDLDLYWSEIEAKDLVGRFAGVRTRPPADFPWGREVHIIDPGGVCWHVRQASPKP
jgi:predicted enzyme related to lactoylglutathione lyase